MKQVILDGVLTEPESIRNLPLPRHHLSRTQDPSRATLPEADCPFRLQSATRIRIGPYGFVLAEECRDGMVTFRATKVSLWEGPIRRGRLQRFGDGILAHVSLCRGAFMKCRVIAVLGTRPEAIKLALVIHELRRRSEEFETAVVHTGQHRTMLDHVLQYFKIKPDFDLDVMRPNQTLNSLTGRVLDTVENACHRFEPNMVLVQGDTTTAFASALAAYYCKIPVGHIEAGLRSHDIYNPFPEEANRRLASVLTEIHFPPTVLAHDNLLAEGVPADKIVITGNTVIDTLRALSQLPHSWDNTPLAGIPTENYRLVLVTSHRRESWGTDQENMCLALKDLVRQHPDIRVIYPVHMNPNVRSTVNALLQNTDRIHLTEPLDYITFVSLLRRCFLVLTDSGGVQEEAPTFGKPVLVLRKSYRTSRSFAVWHGQNHRNVA